jgi:hypothetical protein
MFIAASILWLTVGAVTGCCSPSRDVSTPRAALLGHWENTVPGTNPDLYISDSEVTFEPQKGAETSSVPYTVTSEDEKGFSLEITYQGSDKPTKITFSEERDSMTLTPANIPEVLRYQYVDTKQLP